MNYEGPEDELNPRHWSLAKRGFSTCLFTAIIFTVSFASSADSAVTKRVMEEFDISRVAVSCLLGVYLIGNACGAFFAAPISETIGRNPVYIITMLLFLTCVAASAVAPTFGAYLSFRFLAGFFGSTPFTVAGGSISDLWSRQERTAVFPVFASAGFWGPIVSPAVGDLVARNSVLSWRWCDWITLALSGIVLGLIVLFLPETYGPTLLQWKAQHMRAITGDTRYRAAIEVEKNVLARIWLNLSRPIRMLLYEPIAILFTIYLTLVYVVLFTFFNGYEYLFTKELGLSEHQTSLTFLGLGIGYCLVLALLPFICRKYRNDSARLGSIDHIILAPEARLWFSMAGAPSLAAGLFWMGWTSFESIGPWPPLAASVMVGFGMLAIYISAIQYLIDTFEMHAASALVGGTFFRYIIAGAMVVVSVPLFEDLGVHWTLNLLACISTLLSAVPFLFYKFGVVIRRRSRYAVHTE